MTVPNLRHLQAFHEVVASGSISAAALKMHLTQSAVTQAVAAIERYFDASLFARSAAGMRPTQAGSICAHRVERALMQLRDGLQEVAGLQLGAAERSLLFRRVSGAQLSSLIKLVEFRNFTHAARASGVSQPTIHRAARTLERTLKATLFEKTSYGVVPTREAEKLSRRAHLAFVEIAQARAEIDALRGRESGRTVIGAMALARSFLVPSALIRFTREHTEHAVAILEGTYEHLLAALQSGQADFLIGALREARLSAGIVQEHLFDDPLSVDRTSKHVAVARTFRSLVSRAGAGAAAAVHRMQRAGRSACLPHGRRPHDAIFHQPGALRAAGGHARVPAPSGGQSHARHRADHADRLAPDAGASALTDDPA
jgi:LysR family transcriptional regulator of gallate degradation